MLSQIEVLKRESGMKILTAVGNTFYTIMGRLPEELDMNVSSHFLRIVATNVHNLYSLVLKTRVRIG